MSGQMKKFDNFLDKAGIFVSSPNPYESPKTLGFNLKQANLYAKKHKIKIKDIPLSILRTL